MSLTIGIYIYSQNCTSGNCVNGTGTFVYPNGTIYKGEWKDSLFEGIGELTCTDGMLYTGGWSKGKKNGFGSLTYSTGENYTGQWKNNFMHGQGILTITLDSILVGEWKNGTLLNCMGISPLPDSLNKWTYSKWNFNGQGRAILPNGDVYYGDWKNSRMTGKGIMINKYGEKYEGEFIDGIRWGWGTCFYTDKGGSKYVGYWKYGIQNGKGTLYSPDGSTFVGTFKDEQWWNGIFTDANGKKYTYKNGNEYTQ